MSLAPCARMHGHRQRTARQKTYVMTCPMRLIGWSPAHRWLPYAILSSPYESGC